MRDLSVGCLNINKLPFSDQIKLSATIKHLLTQLNTDITIVIELSCPTSGWQTMVQKKFRYKLGRHYHFQTERGENEGSGRGMWILVRKNCGFDVTFSQVNQDLITLQLKNSKISLTIIGVYAPKEIQQNSLEKYQDY